MTNQIDFFEKVSRPVLPVSCVTCFKAGGHFIGIPKEFLGKAVDVYCPACGFLGSTDLIAGEDGTDHAPK